MCAWPQARLGFVEGTAADCRVDPLCGKPGHRLRRARELEQPPGTDDRDFVAGADGDQAGDELLEERGEAVVGQLEHRGLAKRPDRSTDVRHRAVDVEQLLAHAGRYCTVPAIPRRG